MSVLAAILVVGAAFYVRLSQGPVSLDFMTAAVQSRINGNLSGMAVEIGGVVIERPPGDGLPRFRLRDLALRDAGGNIIARAPRAAIGVDETALWTGRVIPKTLELIGPRIFIKRNLQGEVELGFGKFGTAAAAPSPAASGTASKSDRQEPEEDIVPDIKGGSLIDVLAGNKPEGETGISSIEDIRVSGAAITLFDEANNAIWNAPSAQLAFRRMPYGFVVVTNASVANGTQPGSWHTELSASYRRDSKSFAISARLSDLVPANISEKIFALAQLARVNVPLSGHAEIEITQDGVVTKASAEFAAAAGEVGLPDYLAEPIIVDEGSLRADYDPATGGIVIRDSSLLVGGSRAELTGSVIPLRTPDGRLSSLNIVLSARNATIDPQGTVVAPVAIERIEFAGNAGIDNARLDIDDLVIMSGNSGVRLRGTISGGKESAGILMSGRIRDLSAAMLQKLWPPIIAPKTRNWVNLNIKAGRITEGSFRVNLPVDAMAAAKLRRSLPEGSVDLQFSMADVTTGYFKDLPPLQQASGEAQLLDNNFTVKVNSANLALPSGARVKVDLGSMEAIDILAVETLATFTFKASAEAQALLEYLNLPALSLISNAGIDSSKLGGDASLAVTMKLPLIKDLPRDRVVVVANAKLSNASLKGALDKIDISGGDFAITLAKGELDATGPAKLNGIDAKIAWHRDAGKAARQSVHIEAVLDADEREKIGVDLSEFLDGPVAVTADLKDLGDSNSTIAIEANLSKAAMHIDAINWSRPPTPKTTASLTYYGKGEGGRRIEDLDIEGDGLVIKGALTLRNEGGMKEANLKQVVLGDENSFAMRIKPSDSVTAISIDGKRFDARPLIKSLFGSNGGSGNKAAKGGVPLQITANIDRVYAHRGEEIAGVTAAIRSIGGGVQSADITGTFLSGQPIVMRVSPAEGGRELRITGRDAGAALRAANLYSKIAGGQIDFSALLGNDARGSVQNGRLVIRDFEVRNEAALAELDQKGKPKKSGPRNEGTAFRKLTLPFTTDDKFVRIGESLVKGSDLGAVASGLIRKSDGAIDITGTIIPAYELNAALGEIPLVGTILTGGKGQGVIGLTFALGGSIDKPKFQVNPVSAIAPGFLRKLFEFNSGNAKPPPPGGSDN